MTTVSRHQALGKSPLRTIGRRIGGWPIWLHRLGLGLLVGRHYAVITSVGRRTGATRRAAAMVLREDRATGELFMVAGDQRTNWYRNVCAASAVEIWHGSRRYRPTQRLLSTDAIAELLMAVRRERPREARIQSSFFGWPWPGTRDQLRSLAATLGGVAFRPPAGAESGHDPSPTRRRPEIHFFEEYPTASNLERARLIGFPATVFLAAETLDDFERARETLRKFNPSIAAAWWPVPARSRAMSVFCDPSELTPITEALGAASPGRVLLDLELPVWEPRRMLSRPSELRRARRELDRLFAVALARHEVWTAEWPPAAPGRVLRWLRIALPHARMRVYMLYTSTMPGWWRRLLLGRISRRFTGRRSAIAVGVLASGIAGDEPLLSVAAFERDLREAQRLRSAAVVIYRLGGLEPAHLRAIEEVFGPVPATPGLAA